MTLKIQKSEAESKGFPFVLVLTLLQKNKLNQTNDSCYSLGDGKVQACTNAPHQLWISIWQHFEDIHAVMFTQTPAIKRSFTERNFISEVPLFQMFRINGHCFPHLYFINWSLKICVSIWCKSMWKACRKTAENRQRKCIVDYFSLYCWTKITALEISLNTLRFYKIVTETWCDFLS